MPTSSTPSSKQPDCQKDGFAFPAFLLAAAAAAALAAYLLRRRRTTPPKLSAPAVCALARAWLAVDPDPETRSQVSRWLHQYLSNPDAPSRLPDALDTSKRLRFGTAGIRAAQGPGYDRINSLVLIGVAQALARVVDISGKTVVIGHDARHNSRKFAILLADVFKHAAAEVLLFSKPVPTPFVAYAVLRKSCTLGLCVTASHNPAADNGLKVFNSDGIQIRPDFAQKIERAVPECSRPSKKYALNEADLGPVLDPLKEIQAAYYEQTAKLSLRPAYNSSTLPVVYTACHGVGYPYIIAMFDRFKLPRPIPCVEQCDPDPDFPTLPFPNPEEKGALDLAVKAARRGGARLILANDPDADRLGVAEISEDGGVRIFSGDEIAVLFVDYLTSMCSDKDMSQFAAVASTVSSKIVASIARKRGFVFREGLTGFKWLNKEALTLQEEGKTVLLTYEEALGFNITRNLVRDKDGISAAALFAELAGYVYESGGTLVSRITEIQQEAGVHLSYNGFLRLSHASPSTRAIFEKARKEGMPKKLGKAQVKSVRDLTNGTDTAEPDGRARLPFDGASQFITFRCCREESPDEGGDCPLVLHLRGSGTEPKIKYYAELRCTEEEEKDGSANAFLRESVRHAVNQILKPRENHLVSR